MAQTDELRRWKSRAHHYFDPLWKNTRMKRGSAVRWLARSLGLKTSECHISMFDVETCKLVVELSKKKYKKLEKVNGNKAYDQASW